MTHAKDKTNPRILIVDDSRMVRASIIKHIRERYEFREEADGDSGWQTLLLDPSIELVISDLSMPKLDGFGLLERIRKSKISRIHDIPVVIISGDEDDAARARAKDMGATDFISKGINTVELLARVDALLKLARTSRELHESRAALSMQSPIDPKYGLVTPEYLKLQGAQILALARRNYSEINVIAIEIDRFKELVEGHGQGVANLIIRKLAKILANGVRKEDSVAHLGDAQFCVVSPSTSLEACSAFALRLAGAIENAAMKYRGELIRISLTIGIANSHADQCFTISQLIGLAVQRVEQGHAEGGNRVMSAGGAIKEAIPLAEVFSIERALLLLQAQSASEVKPHLAGITRRLMPLLKVIEDEFKCGIPLGELAEHCGLARPAAEDPIATLERVGNARTTKQV
jgi:diguanylate cyclase (GGDEF)-like protein